MVEILSFFIVIIAGLLFSELFIRFHFPWVVALILGGILIGPFGLGIFESNNTLSFLAEIGLIFLMFMAGIETKLSGLKSLRGKRLSIPLLNGGLPFLVGFGIGLYFGYDFIASLLLGIIFISSSVAVIIPSIKALGLANKKIGKTIISSTVLEDIVSLLLLSIILQTTSPVANMPLLIFYPFLIITLIALRWIISKLRWFFASEAKRGLELFQFELRSIFVILIGTVIVFQFLGLHSIVAGFFAGLVLSGSIRSDAIKQKLNAISYGIFIPIFFVVLGSGTDFSVFYNIAGIALFTGVVIIGSMSTKFISGVIAGRLNGFTAREGALLGASTIPQLSTTLAVAFTAVSVGIFDADIMTVLVALTIVTTFISPLLMRAIAGRGGHKLTHST